MKTKNQKKKKKNVCTIYIFLPELVLPGFIACVVFSLYDPIILIVFPLSTGHPLTRSQSSTSHSGKHLPAHWVPKKPGAHGRWQRAP